MQFNNLCERAEDNIWASFDAFSPVEDRLDKFYFNLLSSDPEFNQLWTVVRLVLILSHGNATVESGFSINADILVENLHEESLVAYRHCYDAIHYAGGVMKVNIDKGMLQYMRSARHKYNES